MPGQKVTTLSGGEATLDGEVVEEFRTRLRGELVSPGSPHYDEVRMLWNGRHDKRPSLIARCTGTADVIEAVNFARENNLLMAVRGGGHNVAGSGSCDGGIMIDLSGLTAVHVDPREKTARRAGRRDPCRCRSRDAGVRPGHTARAVLTTGIAGLTLGGGLSMLRRKYGLALDNLISIDIVTADGTPLTASAEENSDLFWGLRGGGGNFGVVTAFKFRLHPVGPMVTLCSPWYAIEDARQILPAWASFLKDAPEEFSSNAAIWSVPAAPDIPEELHGRRVLILAGVHCGPLEEGDIQPLRELRTPLIDISGPIEYATAQQAFDFAFPKGQRHYYFKSRYINELTDEVIDALLLRAANPPDPNILIVLWQYGGAMQRVGATETAFVGREAPYLFSVDCIWDDPTKDEEVMTYARDFLAEMEPYSPGGLYVNFAGRAKRAMPWFVPHTGKTMIGWWR